MTLRILAVIMMAGVLLISVFFLMYGVATGLGTVFVARPWLGWVITGGVFLLGSVLFLIIHFSKTKGISSNLSKMSGTLIQKIIDTTEDVDVREWIRKHPYQSIGAAVSVGFIVAREEKSDMTGVLKEVILPLLEKHLQSK